MARQRSQIIRNLSVTGYRRSSGTPSRLLQLFPKKSDRTAPGQFGGLLVVPLGCTVVVKAMARTGIDKRLEFLVILFQGLLKGFDAGIDPLVIFGIMDQQGGLEVGTSSVLGWLP